MGCCQSSDEDKGSGDVDERSQLLGQPEARGLQRLAGGGPSLNAQPGGSAGVLYSGTRDDYPGGHPGGQPGGPNDAEEAARELESQLEAITTGLENTVISLADDGHGDMVSPEVALDRQAAYRAIVETASPWAGPQPAVLPTSGTKSTADALNPPVKKTSPALQADLDELSKAMAALRSIESTEAVIIDTASLNPAEHL